MRTKYSTPIGERYTRWTVLSEQFRGGPRNLPFVTCRCDCGTERDVQCSNLFNGITRSCGCLQREKAGSNRDERKFNSAGGRRKPTPTFMSWAATKARCYNQNAHSYARYGGRNIKMCDRWLNSFEDFMADMGERPVGTTLDRYPDVNGNYEPGNCRWATAVEQASNKRNTAMVVYNGASRPVPEVAREVGMDPNILGGRLRDGWPIERAISQPIGKRVRKRRSDC